jgi:SAM-dependent methyltransferase
MPDPLIDYYQRRAPEYERIYQLPERQGDLAELAACLPRLVAGRDVLELACGTGYWTARMAPAARTWLATDLADATLDLARAKRYPPGRVAFARADAFALDALPGRFTAVVAGFLWSHLERARLAGLLASLDRRLAPAARVLFFDNRLVPGSSTPVSRVDAAGNTYQTRRLADGSAHEVRKNFPTAAELASAPPPGATAIAVVELRYYWCLTYLTPAAPAAPA